MSLRKSLARLRSIRKREETDRELDAEIRAHIEIEEEEQRDARLLPCDAGWCWQKTPLKSAWF